MRAAIELSRQGMREGEGGPFGAVVVKDGKIIGRGNNRVLVDNDPTAHAEVVAIRDACRHLNNFQLEGCEVYTSCEPCPMCLSALYWARPDRIFFANTRVDAAAIDFDDDFIYQEIPKDLTQRQMQMIPLLREEALPVFAEWEQKEDKTLY